MFEIILSATNVFLILLQVFMFIRAVLSWIPLGEDNPIESFIYNVTEPFVMPIRALFDYFGWCEGLPIDIPCLVVIVILMVFEAIIGAYLI